MISTRKFKNLAAAVTLALSGAGCSDDSSVRTVVQYVPTPVPTPTLFANNPRASEDGNTVYMNDRRSGSQGDLIAVDTASKGVTTIVDVAQDESAYISLMNGNTASVQISRRINQAQTQSDVAVFNPQVGAVLMTNTPDAHEYPVGRLGDKVIIQQYNSTGPKVFTMDPIGLVAEPLIAGSQNEQMMQGDSAGNFLVNSRDSTGANTVYLVEQRTRTSPEKITPLITLPRGAPEHASNPKTVAYRFNRDLIFLHNGQSATFQKPDANEDYFTNSISTDGLRGIVQDSNDKFYIVNALTGTPTAIAFPSDWEADPSLERTFYGPHGILLEGEDRGAVEHRPMLFVRNDGSTVDPFAPFKSSPTDEIDYIGIWHPSVNREQAVLEFEVEGLSNYTRHIVRFDGTETFDNIGAPYMFPNIVTTTLDGELYALAGRKFVPATGNNPPQDISELVAKNIVTGASTPIVSTTTADVQNADFSGDKKVVSYVLSGQRNNEMSQHVKNLDTGLEATVQTMQDSIWINSVNKDGTKSVISVGYDPTRIVDSELKANGSQSEIAVH